MLLPLAMLALAAVDLVRLRDNGFSWGRSLAVGFCLLLLLFGWVERRHGLETLGTTLRIDRL